MFVACSTLCFAGEPLESALRHIVDLEFNKIDLALHENLPTHVRPSDIAADVDAALRRIRQGPSLTVSALDLDFGDVDQATARKRFEAACRFAKLMTVAVLSIPASPLDSCSVEAEIQRLTALTTMATREGLVVALATHSQTLTADPAVALRLCKSVPGLALTLDPSHYLVGPHAGASFDDLLPYVQNVHFRDTGKGANEFQVRVGQGRIDYARIVNMLERHGYNRALNVSYHHNPDCPFDTEVEVRKLKLLLESLL